MSKFLLRRHCLCRETKHRWGARHLKWLEQLRFQDPVSQSTFDSYLLAAHQLDERLAQLDARLAVESRDVVHTVGPGD